MSASSGGENLSRIGASFANVQVSGALQTLLSAASNTAGIKLRSISIVAATPAVSLFADASAPSAFNDMARRLLHCARPGTTFLAFPNVVIPAGVGLFAFSSAGASDSFAAVSWDAI